jgi:hypothetical protein
MSDVEHNATFASGRVELDGRVFIDCVFQKVRLAYMGRDITALWNCVFSEKDSLEFQLGEVPGKFIWDVGVAYRFGDRALAESVARYIEGTALTLPDSARRFGTIAHLPAALREIAAAIPELMVFVVRFIRGEFQRSIPEPVRLICYNPLCQKISVVQSMLPPGATRSVAHSNAMSCPNCGKFAHIEDHSTDDSGRVFREFADRILRQSEIPQSTVEQLQSATKEIGDKTPVQSAAEIEAIDARLAPIAAEVRGIVDRRKFLKYMAILGVVASAVLLGGTAIQVETASVAKDSVTIASEATTQSSVEAREPTLDESVEALGKQLETICRAAAEDPDIGAVELREMAEACRLEASDRRRLALERSTQTSGYFQQFWIALLRPDVGASALASALIATIIGELFRGISVRTKPDD